MKYNLLKKQIFELIRNEDYLSALLANVSATLFTLDDISWAGVYLTANDKLVLQCFCGLPACSQIPFGKGVCGTSAAEQKVIRVDNVHDFVGHIACDSRSNSELVVPIVINNSTFGIIDLDSTLFSRFDQEFAEFVVEVADALATVINEKFI